MALRLIIVDALRVTPLHLGTTSRQRLLKNNALDGRTAPSITIIRSERTRSGVSLRVARMR
jgi:hypothetical protein